jgi:anthranilate/para-aminobenzoate synthase component I
MRTLLIDSHDSYTLVIRTLVVTPQAMSIGPGGAMRAGSDAGAEVEERRLDARAVLGAIGGTVVGAPAAGAAAGVR